MKAQHKPAPSYPLFLVGGLFALSWLWAWTDSRYQALWPSVLALLVVILTRNALLGLLTGAAGGALILADGNLWSAYLSLFSEHLAPSLLSSWKMGAVAFTLLLGGFAAVLEKGGGLEQIIYFFLKRAKNPSKGLQFGIFGLGMVCFFDGLANSMLVGRITQPLTKRCGVSKEKLAYLVDSTSSAVACLAFVSTWVAYQLSMIKEGFSQIGQEVNPYLYFVQSIPYNFYCWFTLGLCLIAIYFDFSPGAMKHRELKARREIKSGEQPEPDGGGWISVVVPLLVLFIGMIIGFYAIGLNEYIANGTYLAYFPITVDKIAQSFGTGQGPYIMALVGVIASICAIIFFPYRKERGNVADAYVSGTRSMLMPLLILVGAWILGSVIGELKTGELIANMVGKHVSIVFLPALIFIVGALISFSTGTSWGTMGLLMPLAIPIIAGHPAEASAETLQLIYIGAIGAVFSGAVFGDHCSPMSDTTIISSIACGVEPHEHVKTQMPYAIIAAGVSILIGFLPSAWGISPWLCLLLGLALLVFIGRYGKNKKE